MKQITESNWFQTLGDQEKRLVSTAAELYVQESKGDHSHADYSFVVFSMAKAYEGFLKKRFFEMGLIDRKTFIGKRFRIGKALNPDVHPRSRDKYWLYDDIAELCGPEMARELWETWLECRNRVFHFYPEDDNTISIETAGKHLQQVGDAMESLISCRAANNAEQSHSSKILFEN